MSFQIEWDTDLDEDIKNRAIYQEGGVSPLADMSKYDELLRIQSDDTVQKED